MRTFDYYVLRKTLKPLMLALVVALMVLVIERMLGLLDLLLGAQGPLKLVFEIMAFLVPHYIGLALPISLLIGAMVAFNTLSRDGEIDALQGAGIGLARQSRAAVLAACAVAVVTGVTFGYLKPYSRYAYQAMVYTVGNAALQAFVQAGVFTQIGDTTFLVNAVGEQPGTFGEVFLFREDPGDSTTITARGGALVRSGLDGVPVLRLVDGVRLTLREGTATARTGGPDLPPVGVLRFDQLRMVLGSAQDEMFRPRGADERELTITELWQRRDSPPPGVRTSDLAAEFNVRLARTLSVPFLPLLGIPLALGRRRSDRSWGIALGVLVLIVYNQVLDLGKNVAETGAISPFLGLWVPFALFAGLATWLFWRASTRLPHASGVGLFALPAPVQQSIERTFAAFRRGSR